MRRCAATSQRSASISTPMTSRARSCSPAALSWSACDIARGYSPGGLTREVQILLESLFEGRRPCTPDDDRDHEADRRRRRSLDRATPPSAWRNPGTSTRAPAGSGAGCTSPRHRHSQSATSGAGTGSCAVPGASRLDCRAVEQDPHRDVLRKRETSLLCGLDRSDSLLAAYVGMIGEERVEVVARLEELEERANRHARTREDRQSAEHARIPRDQVSHVDLLLFDHDRLCDACRRRTPEGQARSFPDPGELSLQTLDREPRRPA
jgi:hypothetical protein